MSIGKPTTVSDYKIRRLIFADVTGSINGSVFEPNFGKVRDLYPGQTVVLHKPRVSKTDVRYQFSATIPDLRITIEDDTTVELLEQRNKSDLPTAKSLAEIATLKAPCYFDTVCIVEKYVITDYRVHIAEVSIRDETSKKPILIKVTGYLIFRLEKTFVNETIAFFHIQKTLAGFIMADTSAYFWVSRCPRAIAVRNWAITEGFLEEEANDQPSILPHTTSSLGQSTSMLSFSSTEGPTTSSTDSTVSKRKFSDDSDDS